MVRGISLGEEIMHAKRVGKTFHNFGGEDFLQNHYVRRTML